MNNIIGLTITGLVTGMAARFVGGGAEILIVPLLTFFGILTSLKSRIATSLLMLLPPIGIFSAYTLYKEGHGDIYAAMYLAILFSIGSYYSTKITMDINNDLLRQIFGVFTIIAGLYMICYKEH
tara:strand:- start:193 stop:564 length:372 start_codon:yes stop_codon:yes gene_type:complete